MKKSDIAGALIKWRDILGREHMYTTPAQGSDYTDAVCGAVQSISAVIRPASTQEVQQIVEVARACHVPLYPISGGRNWGLGSRLPPQAESVIVDLSRMNRIHEVNAGMCYAIVEPGVTQQQLYEYIQMKNLPVYMNVTGSSKDSSLIGNALERGVGYFDSKCHGLSNLEVVLGNGKVIQTGFGHYANAQTAAIAPAGVGPDLTGLFAQSSFGIVTRATINLFPETDMHAALVCSIDDDEKLSPFIDALAGLRRDGVLRTAAHIVNRERSRISVCPLLYDYLAKRSVAKPEAIKRAEEIFQKESFGEWSAVVPVCSSGRQIMQTCGHVRSKLKGMAHVQLVTDRLMTIGNAVTSMLRFIPAMQRKHAMLDAIRPFYGMTKGIPTDAALASVAWPVKPGESVTPDILDAGEAGLLYCLPIIPMDGISAVRLKQLTYEVCREYDFTPYISMNMMNAQALECVINIAFNKTDASRVERANACIEQLMKACLDEGFIPYRTHIKYMQLVVDIQDPFWQTVHELKQVFDPDGIMAPGRYE